ncbi:MAG: ABC transporter permease [Acutalibacteraceae bacterium]|jgi:spermidine/putrescine transport system permease protein
MKENTSLAAKISGAPYIAWMIIFIIFPLAVVAYFAFTDSTGSFTLNNIATLSRYSDTFLRSIWFGLIATLICLIISYPLAYIISQTSQDKQRIIIMLVMLPMWMNFLLRTYSWMLILEDTGIINNWLIKMGLEPVQMINTSGAVVLGMVYNYLPYMILPLYSIMSRMDNSIIEAAKDLGGNSAVVIQKVIFPLSMPGVVSGITMVFVPSVSTFYISQKLGGGKFTLIGDVIEMQFQTSYNYNLGAAMSLALMVLILACLFIMNKFADEDEGGIIV